MTTWGEATVLMKNALRSKVVPQLREWGFKGSFPHFYRVRKVQLDALAFQFSQFGPALYIEIGSCPATGNVNAAGTPLPPSRVRVHHLGYLRRRIGTQPAIDFEHIASEAEAASVAAVVMKAIGKEGEDWWHDPVPISAHLTTRSSGL